MCTSVASGGCRGGARALSPRPLAPARPTVASARFGVGVVAVWWPRKYRQGTRPWALAPPVASGPDRGQSFFCRRRSPCSELIVSSAGPRPWMRSPGGCRAEKKYSIFLFLRCNGLQHLYRAQDLVRPRRRLGSQAMQNSAHTTDTTSYKCVIVGAGVSGLVAARCLLGETTPGCKSRSATTRHDAPRRATTRHDAPRHATPRRTTPHHTHCALRSVLYHTLSKFS